MCFHAEFASDLQPELPPQKYTGGNNAQNTEKCKFIMARTSRKEDETFPAACDALAEVLHCSRLQRKDQSCHSRLQCQLSHFSQYTEQCNQKSIMGDSHRGFSFVASRSTHLPTCFNLNRGLLHIGLTLGILPRDYQALYSPQTTIHMGIKYCQEHPSHVMKDYRTLWATAKCSSSTQSSLWSYQSKEKALKGPFESGRSVHACRTGVTARDLAF